MKFFQKHSNICVLLIFIGITLAFTFPLVIKFNSVVPRGGGDTLQTIAAVDERMEVLNNQGILRGFLILAKENKISTFFLYVLANLFLGKIAAYNLVFIFSFVMSGFGMYLLAEYFTKNKYAAFLAGLIFAFSPFHFYQSVAVHTGTMHQEWIPFFILFLFKFFEKFELKYYILTGISFVLIALTEHQLLAFTAIFILTFFVYKLFYKRSFLKDKKFWIYLVVSVVTFGIIAITLFGYLLKIASSGENYLDAGIGAAKKYSIKVLDPLIPSGLHSLWPNLGSFLQKNILGQENRGSYFIGFLTIATIVYLAVYWHRNRDAIKKDPHFSGLKFWVIASGVFYIFSLGPAVTINKSNLYLPYFLVYKLFPFYENIRTTGRFFSIAMIGISMLFAYGFICYSKKYKAKKIWKLALIAGVIIILEFWVSPMPTMAIEYSKFYDRLAKESGSFKILEIPGSTDYEFASYKMMTNIVHKKESVDGMPIARKIKDQFDFQQSTPVIKQLLYTLPKGNDPDEKNPPEYYQQANKILKENNIRYITVSKKYMSSEGIKMTEIFVEKYIKYDSKYEDNFLVAYKIAW